MAGEMEANEILTVSARLCDIDGDWRCVVAEIIYPFGIGICFFGCWVYPSLRDAGWETLKFLDLSHNCLPVRFFFYSATFFLLNLFDLHVSDNEARYPRRGHHRLDDHQRPPSPRTSPSINTTIIQLERHQFPVRIIFSRGLLQLTTATASPSATPGPSSTAPSADRITPS